MARAESPMQILEPSLTRRAFLLQGADRLRAGDLPVLARYAARHSDSTCHFGCDRCHDACPEGVEISAVPRTCMYVADYGDAAVARDEYRQIATDASACLSCAHWACTGPLPLGRAHRAQH